MSAVYDLKSIDYLPTLFMLNYVLKSHASTWHSLKRDALSWPITVHHTNRQNLERLREKLQLVVISKKKRDVGDLSDDNYLLKNVYLTLEKGPTAVVEAVMAEIGK